MIKAYNKCDSCDALIKYGEHHVTIQRNLEKGYYNVLLKRNEATIEESDLLLIFCQSCGNKFKSALLIKNMNYNID